MKTVLLTGAFGNVGSFVIRELLAQGYKVVAFDKPSAVSQKISKSFANKVQICWGDITNKDDVAKALSGVDAVIHLAAIFPPASELNHKLADAVNVTGTRYLVELMEQSASAKRLIFASSMGVYGKHQEKSVPPLRATTPVAPDDYYGETKVAGEKLIAASSLDWSILRIAACVPVNVMNMGPFMKNSALALHPDCRVEAIHPADAALAFANAVGCDAAIGKILLLGGGKQNQMTHLQLISTMATAIGQAPLPREIFNLGDGKHYHGDWLDTEEAQRLLKFQRHTVQQQYVDFWNSLGPLRHLIPLFKPLSPLISWIIKLNSPYYRQQKNQSL